MCNINEKNEMIKLILKNSPNEFVIGNPLLSYPVKIVQSNDCIPEQNEWEKECMSYLVKVYVGVSFTIYENLSYGGYIITDMAFDKNIIALTYNNFYDLNLNITRTTFTVNNEMFVFDNFVGLSKVIWDLNK